MSSRGETAFGHCEPFEAIASRKVFSYFLLMLKQVLPGATSKANMSNFAGVRRRSFCRLTRTGKRSCSTLLAALGLGFGVSFKRGLSIDPTDFTDICDTMYV